jgi:hypothetical protein
MKLLAAVRLGSPAIPAQRDLLFEWIP